ncbi:UDP-2,3-diacylglucosamine diphosphatase LpxI [Phenylobacterium sp. SCN 70-31]|uniref:UDP-2,3-diacylglucosamine diphosphatase n=1 Tax=Phenylobacterium sp. SCN 70-31 TaxID=1660129 RepID=UPI00086AB84D|nr:UDP-2,3-diacylglucosamine diphosphatase LpxI [Phenylobacterium sp. SCN 70-31]ODT88012.1 MAG: UDP-2,3-diacylglucosamine pyrophosphatase [Phenylobacterium sp. SCN 70-31]
MDRLGLIAGGGGLPVEIAEHCRRSGRPIFVVRLKGFAGEDLAGYPGAEVGLAELGKCIKALKAADCRAVCLAGNVARPDFASLVPDLRGLAVLPRAVAAARAGDDALLRLLVGEFEREGFRVEGAHEVMADLSLPRGALGRHRPADEATTADVLRALDTARAIGRLDIGQAAVVARGLVLAVEAQEGTDAMLARIEGLPPHLRGEPGAGVGVLAKAPKPIQETRVDLPTIGVATVEGVARAGLAGIAGEAGRLLVLERDAVIARADELGVFVVGVEPPAGPSGDA